MRLLKKYRKKVKKSIEKYYDNQFAKILMPSIDYIAKGEFDKAADNDVRVIKYISNIKDDEKRYNRIKSNRIAILLNKYISLLDSVALYQKDSMEYNSSVKLICENFRNGTISRNSFDIDAWCGIVSGVLLMATRICAMDSYRDIYKKCVSDLSDEFKAKIISKLLGYNCGEISYESEVQPMFERFKENIECFDKEIETKEKPFEFKKTSTRKSVYLYNMLRIADMCFIELPEIDRVLKAELAHYKCVAENQQNKKVPSGISSIIAQMLRKDRCVDDIKEYIQLLADSKNKKTISFCNNINTTLREIETGELQNIPDNSMMKKSAYKILSEYIECGENSISDIFNKCIETEQYYLTEINTERTIIGKLKALKGLYQVKYVAAKQSYWDKFNKALHMVDNEVTEDTVYFVPCDNYLIVGTYAFPLLMAAKKKGCLCVPSSPNTFEFESDDENLKSVAGAFYYTHFKNKFETSRNRAKYKIDIPNKVIEIDGFNVYEPIYEVVSRWQFSLFFNFETNAWARGQVYKLILYFQNVFEQCRALHEWAKKNNRPVRIIHSTPHVQAGAAWRIYCEEEGYKDNMEFIHVRNGYDDYFNSGTGKSATLSALNMTKNPDCRMSLYGTKEGFEEYYRRNSDNIETITEKAKKWFTFQRSVSYDETDEIDAQKRSQIIDTIKKYKAEGKKVYLLIGKLIFDLGVKWTKGTAHDDMSHWATHVVETVNNNKDILLLIKPHPHETRKDVTMTEESVKTFRDIILTEFEDNVIYLEGHLFRNFDLAQYVDVGITWNSTSSLELTSLGIKTVMGDEWGYLDYPLDFIKLTSEEEYADFLNNPDKYEMPEDLPQKAMVFLDYMGSSDVNIPNKYTQTTSTNFNVFESELYYDAIEEYIKHGDEAFDLYFDKIG